jgi:hypothetical protein
MTDQVEAAYGLRKHRPGFLCSSDNPAVSELFGDNASLFISELQVR